MSSTPARQLICVTGLCLLATISCRISNKPAPNSNVTTETVVSTTPPFQTKEPERYQATRTITVVTPKGETHVTKTLIARDGRLRREESDAVVYLELLEGRFVVLPGRQVYAAVTAEDAFEETEDDETSPDRLLHTEPINTTYQALGKDVIDGRTANKYRIVVNNPAAENVTPNETLMWIDEILTMPIRSETRAADGTRLTMQLSDIVLAPKTQLFQIPANYEKIAFRDLWKQRNSARLNP